MIEREQLEYLHKTSSKHRRLIEASLKCGCFYCLTAFPASSIKEWIDDGQTALCPHCRIDAVLPGHVNAPILAAMERRWFQEFAEEESSKEHGK